MSDDSTRILAEGTEDYPLDPSLAVGAESCPHCSADIPDGEQFCPKCGYQRGTWKEDAGDAAGDAVASVPVDAPFYLEAVGGMRYPLAEGETVAGRGEVGIKLDDGYVSRRHASFAVAESVVSITDLGSANGTFIGEEQLPANESHQLAPGTTVRVGQTELTLVAAEKPEPTTEETQMLEAENAAGDKAGEPMDTTEEIPPLEPAKVEIEPADSPWSLARVEGDKVIALPYGETRLGRKEGKCDVLVDGDSCISGLHCRLIAGMDNLDVTDLGSTNGTHVNHERVAPDQTAPLKADDTLRIGQTDLEVVYEAPESASNDASDEVAGET